MPGQQHAHVLVGAHDIACVHEEIVELQPAALLALLDAGQGEGLQTRHEPLEDGGAQLLELRQSRLVRGGEQTEHGGLVGTPQVSAALIAGRPDLRHQQPDDLEVVAGTGRVVERGQQRVPLADELDELVALAVPVRFGDPRRLDGWAR